MHALLGCCHHAARALRRVSQERKLSHEELQFVRRLPSVQKYLAALPPKDAVQIKQDGRFAEEVSLARVAPVCPSR